MFQALRRSWLLLVTQLPPTNLLQICRNYRDRHMDTISRPFRPQNRQRHVWKEAGCKTRINPSFDLDSEKHHPISRSLLFRGLARVSTKTFWKITENKGQPFSHLWHANVYALRLKMGWGRILSPKAKFVPPSELQPFLQVEASPLLQGSQARIEESRWFP